MSHKTPWQQTGSQNTKRFPTELNQFKQLLAFQKYISLQCTSSMRKVGHCCQQMCFSSGPNKSKLYYLKKMLQLVSDECTFSATMTFKDAQNKSFD